MPPRPRPAAPGADRVRRTRPRQQQLVLPLLEALQEAGGAARPRDVYDRVADKVGLDPAVRAERGQVGVAGKDINLFERDVRWARQQAALRGWIENTPGQRTRNVWELTEEGDRGLRNARPGVVITVFETPSGTALWAECESAAAFIERGSVQLIFTSPPYPLLTRKPYENQRAERAHVEWLAGCAEQWRDLLPDDGSLVLNLGDVYQKGTPTLSLYQERLLLALADQGWHLAGRFGWNNPSKMPAPSEWVCVRRVRVTSSLEQIYWFSKTPHPKANNRAILRPYSDRMRARLAAGGEGEARRPSGYALRDGAFRADNGGAIPGNLIVAPNTASNDPYQRGCRALGLPAHPARFPAALPEFFIKFLTDQGDLVADFFGGSFQTAAVADALGRRWVSTEKALQYAKGGALRFADHPALTTYFERLIDAA